MLENVLGLEKGFFCWGMKHSVRYLKDKDISG